MRLESNNLLIMTNSSVDDSDSFASLVILWQLRHGRHDLPWQNTRDAYRVWLSEIMLQQTQVRTVRPYYARFLDRFPDMQALAVAPLTSVLELWSGLGYYARARHLHHCAQTLVHNHAGRFPENLEEIAQLPGIGRSTAAAITVFAFGKRAAILDGNVKRVLVRCFAIEGQPSSARLERQLWELAESLLPDHDIESYSQGMMDLGATICTSRRPSCDLCPLHAICLARRHNRQAELPPPRQGKTLPQQRRQVLLLTDGRQVLLERRPPLGIWGGLLTLPEGVADDASHFAQRHGSELLSLGEVCTVRHDFSHFRLMIDILPCTVRVLGQAAGEDGWQWLACEQIANAALPTPIRKILFSHLSPPDQRMLNAK